MSARIKPLPLVAVDHGRSVEHLYRDGGGKLVRINEEKDGGCALWILTEPTYRNGWTEKVHVRGERLPDLAAAKSYAAKAVAELAAVEEVAA